MRGCKIEIKNLSLTLSGNQILKNLNFTINEGEIHCLIGPNGGGKTSFLRCLLGQMPFDGEIKITYDEKKIIGYVPQILDFEKTLPITVENFMAMTCQTKPVFLGISKKYKAEMEKLLKKIDMFDKRKRLIGNLSGGERQRVLLAQALYPEPNILILDEPLTGIDNSGEKFFKEILLELKEKGITIIWIHHNLIQVREIADKVTCIKQKIIFSGDPKIELSDDKMMRIFE